MDIEKIASEAPEKIITTKIELNNEINSDDIEKIIAPFKFDKSQKRSTQDS